MTIDFILWFIDKAYKQVHSWLDFMIWRPQ